MTKYLLAAGIFIGTWALGHYAMWDVNKDHWSERRILKLLKKMEKGKDRAGMSGYTRFPMGPAYLLYPFYKLGLRHHLQMRLIPLTLSAAAVVFLFLMLLRLSDSYWAKIWSLVFCTVFVLQPGFYQWQTALYSFGLGLAMILLILSVGGAVLNVRPAIWFLLGFVSAWIGYAFIPGQLVALWVVRFLFLLRNPDISLRQALLGSTRETGILFSGVLFSVLTHFIQVWIYYGSYAGALIDLFGSAILRMGADSSDAYLRFYGYAKSLIGTYERPAILAKMWTSFLDGFAWRHGEYIYTNLKILIPTLFLGGFFVLKTFLKQENDRARFLLRCAVAVGGVFFASVAWALLMPYHSSWHFFFISRHFLVGLLMLGFVPLLLGSSNKSVPIYLPKMTAPSLLSEFLLYALPGVPLLLSVFILLSYRA